MSKKSKPVTLNQIKRVLRVLVEKCDGSESHEELAKKCCMDGKRLSAVMATAERLGFVRVG